jgi:acyl-CoA thioester hydrolase
MKMARIEVNLPAKFNFSTEIPIRVSDINRGNHLGHVAMLAMLEEARTRFLAALNINLEGNSNNGYLVTDVAIVYKRQAYYQQTLKIEMAANDFHGKSFDFVYRVSEASSGTEVARAKTGHLLFDFQTQKVAPITPEFRNRFFLDC